MKKPIFNTVILVLFAFAVSCASSVVVSEKKESPKPNDILGKWEGVDSQGKKGAFSFGNDGYVVLTFDGESMGGKGQSSRGSLIYKVNYNKTLIELDIIFIDTSGNRKGFLPAIIEFISPNKMKLRIAFKGKPRPVNFIDGEDDTIVLNRIAD